MIYAIFIVEQIQRKIHLRHNMRKDRIGLRVVNYDHQNDNDFHKNASKLTDQKKTKAQKHIQIMQRYAAKPTLRIFFRNRARSRSRVLDFSRIQG